MKYFMLIIDGVTDEPLESLCNRTPLQSSWAPNLSYLAFNGKSGAINTTFDDYPVESLVCIMGLLGYNPELYYPSGRSSFEAIAKGISVGDEDLVFRCNIVKASSDGKVLQDFTAGMISDSQARWILSRYNLGNVRWELYPGQSYRNILLIRDAKVKASDLVCYEPHMHHGQCIETMMPYGKTPKASELARELSAFLTDSFKKISSMDTPRGCMGNMFWLWSPSGKPNFPAFQSIHGLKGAAVAGLDFMRGLAMAADLDFEVIPGATGYIDTDYEAKANASIEALRNFDFVVTHVNATDEAAHLHSESEKIRAIESIDSKLLGPVLSYLRREYFGDFSIIVCGDHTTRCIDGKHTRDNTIFLSYRDVGHDLKNHWHEGSVPPGSVLKSLDLLNRELFKNGE